MSTLLSAWLAEMVLITYRGAIRGTTAGNHIPHLTVPADYVGSFIVFGALAFIPGEGQRVAGLVGWGFVLATALNLYNPGGLPTTNAAGVTTTPKPVSPNYSTTKPPTTTTITAP